MEYISLNNGIKMPILGFGVYQINDLDECERVVSDAIDVGYRLFDTAQAYYNEEAVGRAIKKSGIPREEFFITTKIWISNAGYDKAKESLDLSLDKLKTDYIDLVLIHQPFGDCYGTYRAMEEYYVEGKIRAIGLSNFSSVRLIDIASFNEIVPMVNQVETHPFNQQIEAQKIMEDYSVQINAWAPFSEGMDNIFENEVLKEIGKKYSKSNAQIVLRWLVQRGVVAIPKSVHKDRMVENFNVFDFELTDEDMEKIKTLDRNESNFFSYEDPEGVKGIMDFVLNE